MIDRDRLDRNEQVAYKALMALVAEDSVFMLTREKIYRYGINPNDIPFTIHDIRFHKQIMTPVPLMLARMLNTDKKNKQEIYDKLFHSTFNNMLDKSTKKSDNVILFSKIMSYIEYFQQEYSYKKHKELMRLIYLCSPFIISYDKFMDRIKSKFKGCSFCDMKGENGGNPEEWFEKEFGKDALIPFPILSNRLASKLYNNALWFESAFYFLSALEYTKSEKVVHSLMLNYTNY